MSAAERSFNAGRGVFCRLKMYVARLGEARPPFEAAPTGVPLTFTCRRQK
jgi:hypothetical protein